MDSRMKQKRTYVGGEKFLSKFNPLTKQLVALNLFIIAAYFSLALGLPQFGAQVHYPPLPPPAVSGGARQPWTNNHLQRSYSDPRLNRNFNYTQNHHYNHNNFHRQSSFPQRSDGHCSTNYKYDYIQLTLQWAPGVCSTSPRSCDRIVNNHFTVHGMWPTIKGTEEPANCCFDNTFDYRALEPIMGTLNDYWYSYYDQNNRRFWSHEWLKHGTCSRDIASLKGELKYFKTTVQLAKAMPILDELKKANIIPNKEDNVYSSSQIVEVLTKTISQGKTIQIDCDLEHQQPIPVLTGLNFCFDSQMKFTDCPDMKKRCRKQVLFRL